jgi:hypothetical protein
MFQNGDWPIFEEEKDPQREASDRQNREDLCSLLKNSEKTIELYGVWNGDFSPPRAREEIMLDTILDAHFWFKEQGFYTVSIGK